MTSRLTQRELQVAKMMADGAKHEAIASELGISVKTAWWYLGQAYKKTGSNGHALLVRWLIRNGLIEP